MMRPQRVPSFAGTNWQYKSIERSVFAAEAHCISWAFAWKFSNISPPQVQMPAYCAITLPLAARQFTQIHGEIVRSRTWSCSNSNNNNKLHQHKQSNVEPEHEHELRHKHKRQLHLQKNAVQLQFMLIIANIACNNSSGGSNNKTSPSLSLLAAAQVRNHFSFVVATCRYNSCFSSRVLLEILL